MLDVTLQHVFVRHLRDISLTFPAGTNTAIIGAPGSGASTLLDVIAGRIQPDRGDVILGTRRVTGTKMSARPLLYVRSDVDVPDRWSVRHALIAAVRRRTLDRVDRKHELDLAAEKWNLTDVIERRIGSLSESERLFVHLARIELLKPAILIADRLLERVNASVVTTIADKLHRTLRVIGTTVISAPASLAELGHTTLVIVLDRGALVQTGSAADVYLRPSSLAAAAATGDVNRIPIAIRGNVVESPIGSWNVDAPAFQGQGIALVRPEDLSPALPGEDSDLLLGIEEARFREGAWDITGFITGALSISARLPASMPVHKGKLIALRYDPKSFPLLQL